MANNTISINKIVSIFRDLTIRHKQLQDFGYGPTYNIESRSEPMLFPYLWLDDIGAVIESTDAGYKSMYYTFDLYVMDKINKGDSNYNETISDTNTILNQIFAEMAQHKYYRDMGLNLNGNITMEPVTEATNDNVNGWKATITLKQPYRLTVCNIPIEPITGYTVSLNSNITEYRLVGGIGPTGPTGSNGATGATGPGANITVDNGLTKIGDNIQLGGNLVENTNIDGYFSLEVGETTALSNASFKAGFNPANLYTTIHTDGAQSGLKSVNIVNDETNSIIAEDGSGVYLSSRVGLTESNFQISSAQLAISNNGANNTMLIVDQLSSKGLVYATDYSTNFTPESLVSKRYVDNKTTALTSSVSNGLTYSGGILKLGGALTENTSITGNLWQLYFNPKTITIDTAAGDLNLYANTGDVNMSSTGDTSIGADGSLYFTTYTGASLYADAGDVNVNVNNGNFNVNAIAGTVSLDGIVVNVNNSKIVNLTTASNPLDAVNYGQLSNTQKVSFGFGADGSGGTLLVGTPTYLVMDHSGTITQWDIVGNTAGTAIFDIWKSTNQTLPTVANTIVASAKPTVGSASYATSIGLTGWGVTYSAGDIYGFNIDSIAAFTKVNLSLRANKS